MAEASLDPIVGFLESVAVIEALRKFVDFVEHELNNICEDIQGLNCESYSKHIQIYDVKVSIRSVADSVVEFVDSVDDLFYYCMKTNFLEIKENAAEDNLNPLQKFVALMDDYLKKIGYKYESFRTDCNNAMRECNAAAERCCKLQAEANTKKNASRVIGGTATAATIVGGTVTSVVVVLY